MKAINQTLKFVTSLAAAVFTNATQNGAAIDLANTQGVALLFSVGVITDGVHTPKVQDSPDNVTWTDVDPSFLVTGAQTTPATNPLTALASTTDQKIGYIGAQRYIRPVVTVTGATTGGKYAVIGILSGERRQPSA